jgi:hypothetical protein
VFPKRAEKPSPTLYHVVIKADDPDSGDVRDRMGLLNAAMARVVKGAADFNVVLADYECGCLELDVWTDRLRGIVRGEVRVQVEAHEVTAA